MDFQTDQNLTQIQTPNRLRSSNITSWSIMLVLAAMLPYLIFGPSDVVGTRSLAFKVATYIFTDIALIAATALCYRNWRQPRIPSGAGVWLCFGLATSCYLLGELVLSAWELYWGLPPNGSPADLAFIGFYLFMIGGIGLLITRQRVTLNWQQSLILFLVSAIATVIALNLTSGFTWGDPN